MIAVSQDRQPVGVAWYRPWRQDDHPTDLSASKFLRSVSGWWVKRAVRVLAAPY